MFCALESIGFVDHGRRKEDEWVINPISNVNYRGDENGSRRMEAMVLVNFI